MKKEYKIQKNGLILNVFEDTIESPREYYKDENITHLVCFRDKYFIGEEHPFELPFLFNMWVENHKKDFYCIHSLYLNTNCKDVDISLEKENDDYIFIGYVYCLNEELKAHKYNLDDEQIITNRIDEELADYNNWQQNIPPYYSFEITDKDGKRIESMGVFEFNSLSEMMQEMKNRSENKYDFLFDALLKKENENCL